MLQDVGLVLWRKSAQYKPGTSFLAWALRVAKLETKDYWKRKARERRRFSDEFLDIVETDAVALSEEIESRRLALKKCLEQLKPTHRDLLRLRYEQNRKLQAVASETGRTLDAVQKALTRIRRALFGCITKRISAHKAP